MAQDELGIVLTPLQADMCGSLMVWAMSILTGDFKGALIASEPFAELDDLSPVALSVARFLEEMQSAGRARAGEA